MSKIITFECDNAKCQKEIKVGEVIYMFSRSTGKVTAYGHAISEDFSGAPLETDSVYCNSCGRMIMVAMANLKSIPIGSKDEPDIGKKSRKEIQEKIKGSKEQLFYDLLPVVRDILEKMRNFQQESDDKPSDIRDYAGLIGDNKAMEEVLEYIYKFGTDYKRTDG